MDIELKTGRQILTEIMNSVADNSNDIKNSARIKFNYGILQELKYNWLTNEIKCTQLMNSPFQRQDFLPEKERKYSLLQTTDWFKSNGIKLSKNKGHDYDYTNIPQLIKDFDLEKKLKEKNLKEEDILVITDCSYFDLHSLFLVQKKDVEELCEKAEKSFNEGLKPRVSYIVETPTIRFIFPYVKAQRYGRPAHNDTWIIKEPFMYGYTELVRNSYEGLEKTLDIFENVFGKMMHINSVLAEHKEDLNKLMKHYVSLNSKIESESWGKLEPKFDVRHRLPDSRDLVYYSKI